MRGILLVILFSNLLGLTLAMPSTVSACTCYDVTDGVAESITDYCQDLCGESSATEYSEGVCLCSSTTETTTCEEVCENVNMSSEPPTSNNSSSTSTKTSGEPLIPNLSIDIPTVVFSDVIFSEKGGRKYISVNYLGDYISGVYRYLLGIGTTIAIVFIMVAGLRYALAAGGGDTAGAKTMIRNAITGLALLLSVYLLLFIINPQLITLKPVELEIIARQNLINLSGDTEGDIADGFTYVQQSSFVNKTPPSAEEKTGTNPPLTKGEFFCPGSGDVTQIVESFYGYVTYRFGGKGGKPPYDFEKDKDSSGVAYSTYCPEGTFCLDCSGFVAMARKCAGLSNKGAGTAAIFKNAPKIKSCTETTVTTEDGKVHTLVPGDLLGWMAGDQTYTEYGHAMIYVRPNRLLEATGTREPGGLAMGETKLTSECTSSVLRYVSN